MLSKVLNRRLTSLMFIVDYRMIFRSSSDLAIQIKLLNDSQQYEKALELFDKYIKNNNQTFSNSTIIQALKACAKTRDIQRGSNIYHLISSRIHNDSYILTSLIHLYSYIRNNQANKAIDVFNKIKNPDEIIVNLLFNACAQLSTNEALTLVNHVSSQMPKSSYSNTRLLTSLLDVWMKCGDVTNAELLYNKSTKKTLTMYGAMMKDNNMINKSIDLYNEIINPNEVIIILLFNACAQLATNETLNLIKKVFKEIPKDYHSNTRLLIPLLDALIKCGDFSSVQIIFSNMEKSVITYSIMMNGYIKENNPKQVLDLFNQMKIDGIEADLIIYLYIIKALSDIGDYSLSLSFIKQIPHSIAVDNRIHNALIDMWEKTGDFDEAKKIFEKIFQPNQIEYTSMINSYGLNGMGIQALELFHQMPSEFIDERTYICILNACSHSGLVDEARSIFDKIQVKSEKIYSTMIDCLSRAAFFEEAQKLIDEFECHHSPVRSMY
ncbi:unnamed protein product, partial [Rotaria sordida]